MFNFNEINTKEKFSSRHIGPNSEQVQNMLSDLQLKNLGELTSKTIPENIIAKTTYHFEAKSEQELLQELKEIVKKNKTFHSMIGMGFYDTFTPPVILRNVFENPSWYTAYTPYQAEISQGRMEALLNFQTMIKDLTAMEIANSSLLDEGSAAAEAMFMAYSVSKKSKADTILISSHCHAHVLEVLETRAKPLQIKIKIQPPEKFQLSEEVFAVLLQYPHSTGGVENYKELTDKAHSSNILVIANTDLLALTLIIPPGEWGADIVTGNSQRFGVPLGFGGPHAAFLATKEVYKRSMPGRLVGVSVDADNKPALRLTLQTREQHIRREKATSNICTAQVLLANMASMFAVYHGPEGLKNIALRVHAYTMLLKLGLEKLGFATKEQSFFDTLTVNIKENHCTEIHNYAQSHEINFRNYSTNAIGLSINETTTLNHIESALICFNKNQKLNFQLADLIKSSQYPLGFEKSLVRTSSYLAHPVFHRHHSETEMLRYIHSLSEKDLSLTFSMIPLGSCTMKLNATSELMPVSWPEISAMHPFVPSNQYQGYLEMIRDLEMKLAKITGFAAVSLQPNAGSQGEYAGLLVVRKYFEAKNEAHRNICLIPSSAHGTNPASAALAGLNVVVVACDNNGNVDTSDLKTKAQQYRDQLACLMITYPSTHGVFEESIVEICKIIHAEGGQVYMDGANMNALVSVCLPGEFGPDVAHLNLHKTFAIPHGGGGPGVGPICVREHLKPYLPSHRLTNDAGPKTGITAVASGPWGSASVLPISWMYVNMMGSTALREATLISILNANYIAKKLEPYYPVLYKGKNGFVAHECIIDLRDLKKESGIDVTDVAKRLMDYGFHAPTMSWPVAGTLMIEPTESESKAELDRFIQAMIQIRHEINAVTAGKMDKENNTLKNSPHTAEMLLKTEWNHPYSREEAAFPLPWIKSRKFWPSVRRVDNVYGDKHVVCACPSIESYKNDSYKNSPLK
jgi:glycine dehydrogenase